MKWRWLHRDDPLIDTLIKPPVKLYAGADEAMSLRTRAKREAANVMRQRASAVESGAKVGAVLKMAAKR